MYLLPNPDVYLALCLVEELRKLTGYFQLCVHFLQRLGSRQDK